MSKPNSVGENWKWGALPLLTQVGYILYLHNEGKSFKKILCSTVWWWKHLEVYMTNIFSMLAETKRLPPDIHRWLNGKRKTFLKLERIAELTNVYKQVYCTLKYAWMKKRTQLHWLNEMVWKLMHFQAKLQVTPAPPQAKTKYFFPTQFIKKRNTL